MSIQDPTLAPSIQPVESVDDSTQEGMDKESNENEGNLILIIICSLVVVALVCAIAALYCKKAEDKDINVNDLWVAKVDPSSSPMSPSIAIPGEGEISMQQIEGLARSPSESIGLYEIPSMGKKTAHITEGELDQEGVLDTSTTHFVETILLSILLN